MPFPQTRLRRLRATGALRGLVRETTLSPSDLVYPMFVAHGIDRREPIGAMPGFLATIAKFLPLTHVLALLRYAVVDPTGRGLHDIWGMSNVTAMAALSLTVVALFAAVMTAAGIRAFTRAAIS